MNQVMVYKDSCSGTTAISNVFIDSFMKDANDAQLKIYLYLIRVLDANMSISITEMADKFNHTEKDVIRSLQYWERNGLVSLDYDECQNISGIRMHTPQPPKEPIEKTLAPIVSLVPSTPSAAPASGSKVIPEHVSYSADELKAFREDEETGMMLHVAEQYLGKLLSATELMSLLYIEKELHFSSDLIDSLLQYCVERGKKELRYIEKVAVGWYEQGIKTPKQALKIAGKYDNAIYSIMKALGKSGTPTAKEVEYINKWTITYGFSSEIIAASCARTVLATDSHRFEYADGILSSWKKQNVHTVSDINLLEAAFKKEKSNSVVKASGNNKFNQFTKTNYDFDALERDILSN